MLAEIILAIVCFLLGSLTSRLYYGYFWWHPSKDVRDAMNRISKHREYDKEKIESD